MTLPFSYGVKNCFFIGPATFNPSPNGRIFYVGNFSPVDKIHSFSVDGYFMVSSSVIALLRICSPFYIPRKISFIITNTLNRIFFGRSWPNVIVKCHKVVSPSTIYEYASTAIIVISRNLWHCASLDYMRPRSIFRSRCHAMHIVNLASRFNLETTTTSGSTRCKTFGLDDFYIPASAFTIPLSSPAISIFSTGNNRKPTECLSSSIYKIMIWHLRILQAKVTSIIEGGRQLLEDCFSGDLPYPLNIFTEFLTESQGKRMAYDGL